MQISRESLQDAHEMANHLLGLLLVEGGLMELEIQHYVSRRAEIVDVKCKTVISMPAMNPAGRSRHPRELTERVRVIVHHHFINLLEVRIRNRVLSMASRLEHLFSDLARQGSKGVIVGSSDSHRKYFRKQPQGLFERLGSAVMKRDANSIVLFSVHTVKVGHQNRNKNA